MGARSSTTMESPYSFFVEMRTLSRPRAEGATTDLLSVRITNILSSTREVPVKWTQKARRTREKRDVPYDRFFMIASVWLTKLTRPWVGSSSVSQFQSQKDLSPTHSSLSWKLSMVHCVTGSERATRNAYTRRIVEIRWAEGGL